MGANYHTAWIDGTTTYKAADMNAPLSSLDSQISNLSGKTWYVAGNYVNAKPPNSALILRVIIGRYMELPSSAPGSYAGCGTAPTAQATLTIKKDGSSVGTITIDAAATTGSFTVASDVRFYPGETLSVEAPASQDATLKDISVTLKLTTPGSYTSTSTTTTTSSPPGRSR